MTLPVKEIKRLTRLKVSQEDISKIQNLHEQLANIQKEVELLANTVSLGGFGPWGCIQDIEDHCCDNCPCLKVCYSSDKTFSQ